MSDFGPVRCIWPVAATLGEGPVWDAEARCLWFVDIKQGHLHRYDPQTGERQTVTVGRNPSFVLPASPGGLVIGDRDRLILFDPDFGTETTLATLGIAAHDRCNDATVDACGRVWFGTMDDEETRPTGAVHLFDSGTVQTLGGGAIVTNGPAITTDGRWLYHVDSAERVIWRFDISAGDWLEQGEPFVRLGADESAPDGVTIDAEDHLWVGLWGGGCARRYAPDGRIVAEVRLPCANVTKLAFGGPDLRTAYVTTARAGRSAEMLHDEPLAGGLFAFDVTVPGVPLPRVALEQASDARR